MSRASLVILALGVLALRPTGPLAAQDPALAHANALLSKTLLVDGHNDLPWEIRTDSAHPGDVAAYDIRGHVRGMTDFPRMRAGHLGGQFWSIYIPGEIKDSGYARVQLEQFDIARRMIAQYPDKLVLALTADDIVRAKKQKKIASLLGMEGGHAIENSLGVLRIYYELGARYMTLTHNVTLDWADAALDSARHGGLTEFGKEVVREMNRMGMLVDLSHVSPGTMSDALDVTEAPVIFSHSGSRELVDHKRNIPDSILARLPKNGGVVMVPFVTSFVSKEVKAWSDAAEQAGRDARARLGSDSAAVRRAIDDWNKANPQPKATLAQVADHIEHVRKIAGVDHVGIGSDFDGITDVIVG